MNLLIRAFYFTVLLVLPFLSPAQPRAEGVKNAKDMIAFLDHWYFKGQRNDTSVRFTKYVHPEYQYYVDSNALRYAAAQKSPAWIKKDYNKDGKKDILFCGYINEAAISLAFISQKDGYHCQVLTPHNCSSAIVFIQPYRKKSILLNLLNASVYDDSFKLAQRLRTDTITFKGGRFIDYAFGKTVNAIDSFNVIYGVYTRRRYDRWYLTPSALLFSAFELSHDSVAHFEESLYQVNLSTDSLHALLDYCSKIPMSRYNPGGYGPIDDVLDGYIWAAHLVSGGMKREVSDVQGTAPLALRELYTILRSITNNTSRTFIRKLRP